MFIGFRCVDVREIHHLAGMQHFPRYHVLLVRGQAVNEHRHHKRRDLIIFPRSRADAIDERGDLGVAERLAVAFLLDDVLWTHLVLLTF